MWTHALLVGSPALDGGDPAGCTDSLGAPLTADQRGQPRPADGDGNGGAVCDLGAYEAAAPGATATLTPSPTPTATNTPTATSTATATPTPVPTDPVFGQPVTIVYTYDPLGRLRGRPTPRVTPSSTPMTRWATA